MRWAWAEVSADAIANNVRAIQRVAGTAEVWAVVKANGYGHGACVVARAALGAGARGLCVALVDEGAVLRRDGIDGPILVLSEQPPEQAAMIVEYALTATVYTLDTIDALAREAARCNVVQPVHLKIDTGMHRVGAPPASAVTFADAIAARSNLSLQGVFTHLAMADEPAAPSNVRQLSAFSTVLADLADHGHRPPMIHAANSAGALALPESRGTMVRVGIAMYGIEPGPGVRGLCADLQPAMSLRARVSAVSRLDAGEGVSYGLRHHLSRAATVATVPLGYADGVSRRLFEMGAEVLIHGRRRPIIGAITMDQLMVDCADLPVAAGDLVTLLGAAPEADAEDPIRAEEWAARLGTIGYEVVCGISGRIERRHV